MGLQAPDRMPPPLTTRSLTVVVVAHEDPEGLSATIERLYRALVITVDDFEVIVFDDGSTDSTGKVAACLSGRYQRLRVVRNETQMGAGYCFEKGIETAATNFLVYVPADNTWPYRSYVELFGNIGKADVITSYSGNLLGSMSPFRRAVSRAYTFALNVVFRLGLHYYNGLTVYPVAFLRSAQLTSTGLSFQAEALIKAILSGYSFVEVALPVDNLNVDKSRAVTLNNVIDAISMLLRTGTRFYFVPKPNERHRTATARVALGQTVDEIGIRRNQAHATRTLASTDLPQDLRIAVVGASSGIGEALARAFGREGHCVFICARRGELLEEIARSGPSMRPFVCDVTKQDDVARFAADVATQTDRIDVLINSVGSFGEIGPVELNDADTWWHTLEVNLRGPYLVIKHFLPLLDTGRDARIINVAGGGAFSPFPNYSAYACSKAALVRLTECLAVELQPRNIRVNAISPGFIATAIHQSTLAAGEQLAGRLQYRRTLSIMNDRGADMEDIVACVRLMLSPCFNRLTGKTISANFDPWQTKDFLAHIEDITASDLYTLRRVNVAGLTDGYLRKKLVEAWANHGSDT